MSKVINLGNSKDTVEIAVIVTKEFTNHFMPSALKNLQEVIEFTQNNSSHIDVSLINFYISKADKDDRLFNLDLLPIGISDVPCKITVVDSDKVYDVLNLLKTSDAKFTALYYGNTLWVKNHIIESVNAINVNRKAWSVSIVELHSDITLKKPSVISYKQPNPNNALNTDILMGEIVVKTMELNKVEFKRGRVVEDGKEFYFPAYALKAYLEEFAVCKLTTVRYYMSFSNEAVISYPSDKPDSTDKLILPEDKDKVIFSVLVNLSGVVNQDKVAIVLNSLSKQTFPKENFEVIILANYNSASLYLDLTEFEKLGMKIKVIYIANALESDDGSLEVVSFMTGSQKATGEILTYYNVNEGFLYTETYLAELYKIYQLKLEEEVDGEPQKITWLMSNYYEVINYEKRHSNLKNPSRENCFYTLFSHRRMPFVYLNLKSIDRYCPHNELSLLNMLNQISSSDKYGSIIPVALIQKI